MHLMMTKGSSPRPFKMSALGIILHAYQNDWARLFYVVWVVVDVGVLKVVNCETEEL